MDAIVQHKQDKITPFSPDNVDQAMRLCDMLARSALVPQAVRGKPADIFVILATGRELGIGPMQALSDINVIQGKPVFSADLMIAQCKRRSDVCQYIRLVESTDTAATYETQRVGSPSPERFTFTIEDARRLGLAQKDNYQKQPRTMLRRRAGAALAREVYPDLVRGYDPDEAADFAPPVRAAPAPVPEDPPVAPTPAAAPAEPDATQRAAEAIVEQVQQTEAKAPSSPQAQARGDALWRRLVGTGKGQLGMTATKATFWMTKALKSLKPIKSIDDLTDEQLTQIEQAFSREFGE